MLRVQLPWYNFSFLRDDYVALWTALSGRLRARGLTDLPLNLDPSPNPDGPLGSPHLLCSQTCGYDLAIDAPVPLKIVLTPTFTAPGCGPGTYRSFVVVRRTSSALNLDDLRGARFVANDDRSWSGYHCLRDHHATFGRIEFGGSHVAGLARVRAGLADVAAIDCVTWEFLRRYRPWSLDTFRVIGRTAAAPAPPLVTAVTRTEAETSALRSALIDVVRTEPELCARLLIENFVKIGPEAYAYMSTKTTYAGRIYGRSESSAEPINAD